MEIDHPVKTSSLLHYFFRKHIIHIATLLINTLLTTRLLHKVVTIYHRSSKVLYHLIKSIIMASTLVNSILGHAQIVTL